MPSSMRLLLTLGTVLLGLGCGSSDNSVLLTLTSAPPRTTQLAVTALLDQKPLMDSATSPMALTLPLTQNQLGLTLPATGHLTLDIRALDSDQCLQGSTHAEVDVIAGLTNLSASITPISPRKCGSLPPCAAGATCTIPSGTSGALRSIWTIAANDIWAVGDSAAVLHYDGNAWTATPAATALVPSTTMWNGVWASASNDVWVVGSAGRIIHYDGTKWSISMSGAQRDLEGISGIDSQNIWVVGVSSGAGTPGVFLHWTGGPAWTQQTPFGSGNLYTVLAVKPNFIIVGGGDGNGNQVLWSFDGASKFIDYSDPLLVPVYALWGTLQTRVIAVGAAGEILIFNGSKWSLTENSLTTDFSGVTSDGTTTYVVGSKGSGFSSTDPALAKLTAIPKLPSSALWSVRLASNGLLWIAGDSGYLSYVDTRP